jgi:spermidine/putrescine transport system permease protein
VRPVSRLGSLGLGIYFWAFVAFLFVPLVVLVIFSVNNSTIPSLPWSGFTTRWFHQAFSNGTLTTALVRSVVIALAAALLATAFGIMASIGLLALRGRALTLALAVLLLPLVVPYICLAVGLLILVQEVSAQPTLVAVVLGHAVIALPFAILVILPRLRSLDPAMNEAALDLGASSFAALRYITLPLLTPALVSSVIICLSRASTSSPSRRSWRHPASRPTRSSCTRAPGPRPCYRRSSPSAPSSSRDLCCSWCWPKVAADGPSPG